MTAGKTTDETTRAIIGGTELVRLATSGANWKATLASIISALVGTPSSGAVPVGQGDKFASVGTGLDGTVLTREAMPRLLPLPGVARSWTSIDGNVDASFLVASDAGLQGAGGYICTSTDFGQTWTQRTAAGSRAWAFIVISGDGSSIYAADRDGYVYKSTNGGAMWSSLTSIGATGWRKLACSGNGQKVVAFAGDEWSSQGLGKISSDGGATWRTLSQGGGSVCMSDDGLRIYTSGAVSGYYVSTDGGATWHRPFTPFYYTPPSTIFCSPDGLIINTGGSVSTDGGATWADKRAAIPAWPAMMQHMSADGKVALFVQRTQGSSGVWLSRDGMTSFTQLEGDQGPGWWTAWCNRLGNIFVALLGGGLTAASSGNIWLGTSFGVRWKYGTNFVNIQDFGAVGDGVTNNDSAINAFHAWMMSSGFNSVTIIFPPGHYVNTQASMAFWQGIDNIVVWGYGATIDYWGGGAGFTLDWTHSARVQNVQVGDNGVTLITKSDASRFAVGDWIQLGSVCMMGSMGSPTNHYNTEFHQILSIDTNTGVIVFNETGQSHDGHAHYRHLTHYPAPNPTASFDVGGPAAIFKMRPEWKTNATFMGLTWGATGMGGGFASRRIHCVDCDFRDCSNVGPSVSVETMFERCRWYYAEIDKAVQLLRIIDCEMVITEFQSASIMVCVIDGCRGSIGITGNVRNWVVKNSFFNRFTMRPQFGRIETILFENCHIPNLTYDLAGCYTPLDSSISLVNGAFRQDKASGNIVNFWQLMVPGQRLVFRGGKEYLGSCLITDIYEDANYYYADTTLALWPTWTGVSPPDSLCAHPAPCITAINCRGGQAIADLTQAPAGTAFKEYGKRLSFGTNYGQNNAEAVGVWGKLVKIRINVIRAYTGANAHYFMLLYLTHFTPANVASIIDVDNIDIKIVGERVYLPGSVTGKQTTDVMTTIPAGNWLCGDLSWFFYASGGRWDMPPPPGDPIAAGELQTKFPIVEIEAITDQGAVIKTAGVTMTKNATLLW